MEIKHGNCLFSDCWLRVLGNIGTNEMKPIRRASSRNVTLPLLQGLLGFVWEMKCFRDGG